MAISEREPGTRVIQRQEVFPEESPIDHVPNRAVRLFRSYLEELEHDGQDIYRPRVDIDSFGRDIVRFHFPTDNSGISRQITVAPVLDSDSFSIEAIAKMPGKPVKSGNGRGNFIATSYIAGCVDVLTDRNDYISILADAYQKATEWTEHDLK